MKLKYLACALLMHSALAAVNSHDTGFDTGTTMNLGKGFDVIANDSKGSCVQYASTTNIPETDNGKGIYKATYSMELIENLDDLAKSLRVTASASLKWGIGKGSASMEYIETQKIHKYSIYILVKQEIITHIKELNEPQIKPEFLDKLKKNLKSFRSACGDEFVVSLSYGGAYYGILRLDTQDEDSYKSLKVEMSAKVGSFSSAASMQSSLSHITSNKQLKISTYRLGGSVSEQPTDLTEFLTEVERFPLMVVEKPAPIDAKTNIYDTIGNFPADLNVLETAIQEENMDYLGKKRMQLVRLRNDIQYVFDNPEQFKDFNFDQLEDDENQINGELRKVDIATRQCFNDIDKCFIPTDLNIPKVILPHRKGKLQTTECKETTDPVCGYIFFERQSPACEPKSFVDEPQEKCGVESFLSGRSEVCGIESYKTARNPNCGVEQYREGTGEACGCAEWGCSGARCNGDGPRPGNSLKLNVSLKSTQRICERWFQCRHPSFGVDSYKACANPANGVNQYNECRDASFGVEKYKSCPGTIPLEYGICRHESHGIQGVKTCNVKYVTDNLTNSTLAVKCNN